MSPAAASTRGVGPTCFPLLVFFVIVEDKLPAGRRRRQTLHLFTLSEEYELRCMSHARAKLYMPCKHTRMDSIYGEIQTTEMSGELKSFGWTLKNSHCSEKYKVHPNKHTMHSGACDLL